MRKIGFSQKTSWEKGVVEKQPKEKIWFSKGLKDLENNLFTILVLEETVNNLQFYLPDFGTPIYKCEKYDMNSTIQMCCVLSIKANFKSMLS